MRFFKRKAVVKNAPTPLPPQIAGLLQEAWWLAMVAFGVYLVLILASYSPSDPSWSHSASGQLAATNWGGQFGAYFSDLLLYIFGLSAWWLVVFFGSAIVWGYRKIRRLSPALDRVTAITCSGFLLVLIASSGLEALRLNGMHLELPLAPGGMLGHFVGFGLRTLTGSMGALLILLLGWAVGV
ncbi:MAG: DNA translocase FtsK 4TM domain-containing protein, partial [Microvirgula sp.]